MADDEDLEDLEAICILFSQNKRRRSIKFKHDRKDWDSHVRMLLTTNKFDNCFCMSKDHFDFLLEAIREGITVDYLRSMNSTGGNDRIFPEIVMAMGLRFLGLGSTVPDLADLYGTSVDSARRVINMFLDAIDYNTECLELQVRLPDPTDLDALHTLAQRWVDVSGIFGLFNNTLGAIDQWLPHTEMPGDVPNQTDYFSGHYQCYGLNVQAVCDPDLIFLYVAVAAPGKVNDIEHFIDVQDCLNGWKHCLNNISFLVTMHILFPGEFWYHLVELRITLNQTGHIMFTYLN